MTVSSPQKSAAKQDKTPNKFTTRRIDREHQKRDGRKHVPRHEKARTSVAKRTHRQGSARQRIDAERRAQARIVKPANRSGLTTMQFLERSLVYFGFLVAASLIALTASDLIVGFPFSKASTLFDWGFLIAGAVLLWLSWDVYQDQHPKRNLSRVRSR